MSTTAYSDDFREMALALLDASDNPRCAQMMLRDRFADIRPEVLCTVAVEACIAMAFIGEITPRTIHDRLFAMAPEDAEWEVIAEAWREDRI